MPLTECSLDDEVMQRPHGSEIELPCSKANGGIARQEEQHHLRRTHSCIRPSLQLEGSSIIDPGAPKHSASSLSVGVGDASTLVDAETGRPLETDSSLDRVRTGIMSHGGPEAPDGVHVFE